MSIKYHIKEIQDLLQQGFSPTILVGLIYESLEKHNKGLKITEKDKFYAGLRYSEFLADSDSDESYVFAEKLRSEYYDVLDISFDYIVEELRKLGWH